MDELAQGVLRFREQVFPTRREEYARVASHQVPLALFITCADSRLDPELLTGSGPGRIFVERNPGNLVPVWNEAPVGVSASIEYAVAVLDVSRIVVCGHSDCGAMQALLYPEKLSGVSSVARWLKWAEPALARSTAPTATDEKRLRELTEANVLTQMAHLATHPSVATRVRDGRLTLHGWLWDLPSGEVFAYDEQEHQFRRWPS